MTSAGPGLGADDYITKPFGGADKQGKNNLRISPTGRTRRTVK